MFDLDYCLKRLKNKYPLFRVTIAALEFTEDPYISTAATDSKFVYYNKMFMNSLGQSEQLFVLAHEICHVALEHIKRLNDKNMHIWNIATDAIINAFLIRDGLTPPDGIVLINNALNYSSEELYKKLLLEEIQVLGNINGEAQKHSKWGNSSYEFEPNVENETDNQENDFIDERKIFKENEIARKKEENDFKNRLNNDQSCYVLDSPLESVSLKVNRDFKRNRLIDWRLILRENIKYNLDYSYRNAFIEDGIVTARLEEDNYLETEVLIDTSGSISLELINRFLNECIYLLDISKLKIGFFDDSFYGFIEIRSTTDFKNINIIGGGGTNFNLAANSFSKSADNKIIFTDGEGYYNNKKSDIIWVVFGNNCLLPKELKIIKIKI